MPCTPTPSHLNAGQIWCVSVDENLKLCMPAFIGFNLYIIKLDYRLITLIIDNSKLALIWINSRYAFPCPQKSVCPFQTIWFPAPRHQRLVLTILAILSNGIESHTFLLPCILSSIRFYSFTYVSCAAVCWIQFHLRVWQLPFMNVMVTIVFYWGTFTLLHL